MLDPQFQQGYSFEFEGDTARYTHHKYANFTGEKISAPPSLLVQRDVDTNIHSALMNFSGDDANWASYWTTVNSTDIAYTITNVNLQTGEFTETIHVKTDAAFTAMKTETQYWGWGYDSDAKRVFSGFSASSSLRYKATPAEAAAAAEADPFSSPAPV